ncbi:PAS domain-containing sensor histidine kinase [Mucilaginibacter limnophilus]|uniref:histidine kinase n=1 Tax=Mucilaginibacter limnophilus TaxID=1932778 RepID=A0A437MYG6_9SPHI|nr:PAS domain-containing hybrid sensor histidine kinase/response regulator [Mucilaginibacter limnophilus]RVU02722.1 PAS domain-containing sensor histidine kinase [Mucilaginibacter limnophilus]
MSHFIFNTEQLNRIFPYYILLNNELGIDACGAAYNNVLAGIAGRKDFTAMFTVGGKTQVTYNDLVDLTGQFISLLPLNNGDIKFQGQLEYLEATGQFLFAGNTLKGIAPPDISSNVNSKGILKGKLDFYEDVLNQIPADVVVYDNQHRYVFISHTAIKDRALRERLIGLKDEDFCWLTNRPESLAQERHAYFNEVVKTRKLKTWEEKVPNADGSESYHLRNMYPLLDEDNHVKFVIGYGLDITDRKLAEEKLIINEKKYKDLYNFGTALIYTHDMRGNLRSVNPAISNTLGYTEEEVTNNNIRNILPVYDRNKIQHDYLDKVRTQGTVKGISRVVHKNGSILYLHYQGHLAGDDSNAPYVIGFAQDITDRIKIEKELRAAKVTTESAARAKEIFLANMSHEIRTPMNGILGLNMLLSKTELNEQQLGYTRMISESVKNLLTIVNDILDIEKISSGKLELESKPFNISNKIARTLQLFQYKSKEKDLSLILNNRLPDEFVVIGDQYRFAQILSNLINNSIKFTKKGDITVSASLLYNANDKVLLEFSVKDTGIGISPDRLPVIFDSFVQGSSHMSRKYGGTGLGLSICKSLVEMQGGHIKVHSKLNQGTEFIFSLTYKKGLSYMQKQGEEDDVIDPELLRDRKILVAEDVELNQFLVRNVLESWGCVVDIVSNGAEAVERVKDEDYDVVLMDIQMPEMDGITATRHIRQFEPEQHRDVPIIAFTANALKGDSQYYKDAGMNDCVMKPYTEEDLFKKITDVLRKSEGPDILHLGNWPKQPDRIEVITAEPEKEENEEVKQTPESTPMEGSEKLYDLTMIETISKNNESFVNKMILMFCDVTSQDVDKLKEAAAQGNWETVSQLAHKLKSTVGNMGVESLKDVVRALELKASDNPQALVEELDEKLNKVKAQLKADHPSAFEPQATN